MDIGKFRHKGLRRLYQDDDTSLLPSVAVSKISRILGALEVADKFAQVETFHGWKLHALKGDRKGFYALTVTANWRLTFRLDGNTVTDIDFEDYH